jgi:poly(3-hydroxybutyrate) depolymerase
MARLARTIADLSRYRRAFDSALGRTKPQAAAAPTTTKLREVAAFGANPGNLRMLEYVPATLAEKPALLVVLHGCTQTAAGYDHGAGWTELADRHGFALMFPEQKPENNPQRCFTWFEPADVRSDGGEAASIRQMITRMAAAHDVDRARIFITGLSAGGAMASAMLAAYPEVFADATVVPMNRDEIVKQWTDVHGLPATPSERTTGRGFERAVWRDLDGRELIEAVTIPGMAHGTPLATGPGEECCGNTGPFLLEVGVSSSHHIAQFFGLADAGAAARDKAERHVAAATAGPAGAFTPSREDILLPGEPAPKPEAEEADDRPRLPIDVQAVIAKALRAAGLMRP